MESDENNSFPAQTILFFALFYSVHELYYTGCYIGSMQSIYQLLKRNIHLSVSDSNLSYNVNWLQIQL